MTSVLQWPPRDADGNFPDAWEEHERPGEPPEEPHAAEPREPFEVTRFSKDGGGLLSKSIELRDGKPVSDGSACWMSKGEAQRVWCASLSDFAALIEGCGSHQAIAIGTLRSGLPDRVTIVSDDFRRKHPNAIPEAAVGRTLESFRFAEKPGVVLLDIDLKGMPEEVRLRLGSKPFWSVLSEVVLGLKGAARVTRSSTSAGLGNRATGERFTASGGQHIYLPILDMRDAVRMVKTIFERLWLAGYGWVYPGSVGQLLVRSLVDIAVASPERLVFEGAPVVKPPLAQDRGVSRPHVIEGSWLDSRAAVPSLTRAERLSFEQVLRDAKAAAKPEADRIAFKASRKLAEEVANESGETVEVVEKRIRERRAGRLSPDIRLDFDARGGATVADVLANPDSFLGATLADPLEGVDYGRGKAKVLRGPDGEPVVHTFAHGGTLYRLCHNMVSLEVLMGRLQAAGKQVTEPVMVALKRAMLNDAERERVRDRLSSATGASKKLLGKMIENVIREGCAEAREEAFARDEDSRVLLPAPAADAESVATVKPIDDIIAADWGEQRPLRDLDHWLAAIRPRSSTLLHQLDDSWDSDGEYDPETALPAAPSLTIERLEGDQAIQQLVERNVRFIKVTRDGPRAVALPTTHCRGLNALRSASAIPVVTGVQTLPLVIGGRLLVANGYDAETRLFFSIDAKLTRLIGWRQRVPVEDALRAFRWLADEWLVDVSTNIVGKAVLISEALTLIEHNLISDQPVFITTAGQRGGGKTTAQSMVSMAVLGQRAAASAWSPSEEERRKVLMAIGLAGTPFVVFDNIKKGETISCPHLSRFSTSGTFSDRLLGASKQPEVPSTTTMALTGNNIRFGGDMASRGLRIEIEVDRPDPENRAYRHSDPLGWTQRHRGRVLEALYTILLVERRPDAATGHGRFPHWWTVIGNPVELASGEAAMSFRDHLAENEDDNDEVAGVSGLLVRLRDLFGFNMPFRSGDVVLHMEWSELARTPDYLNADVAEIQVASRELRSVFEEATAKHLPPTGVTRELISSGLRSIVGQVCLIDGQNLKLSMKPDHKNGATYKIE